MSAEEYPLTKYDDFPFTRRRIRFLHSSTDFSFDEGYMWGAVNPDTGCIC